MRFISFNINGIRARSEQIPRVLAHFQPDVIGFQETKIADDVFPVDLFAEAGYEVAFHGQKGHYGVALASKAAPTNVQKSFPGEAEDAQRRMIAADYPYGGTTVRVINGYYPQGESRDHPTKFPNKRDYYANMYTYLQEHCDPDKPVVVMGDMNVAPLDDDIGIGEQNAKRWLRQGKTSFLPEEREWLQKLMDWGLYDLYDLKNPDVEPEQRLSWFDYRSRGFEREPKHGLRIDLILGSAVVRDACTACTIDWDFRADAKPSDHCAVIADLSL